MPAAPATAAARTWSVAAWRDGGSLCAAATLRSDVCGSRASRCALAPAVGAGVSRPAWCWHLRAHRGHTQAKWPAAGGIHAQASKHHHNRHAMARWNTPPPAPSPLASWPWRQRQLGAVKSNTTAPVQRDTLHAHMAKTHWSTGMRVLQQHRTDTKGMNGGKGMPPCVRRRPSQPDTNPSPRAGLQSEVDTGRLQRRHKQWRGMLNTPRMHSRAHTPQRHLVACPPAVVVAWQ
jgi:hypothetical protein